MDEPLTHVSVLYQECLDALQLLPGKTIVDGTFGAGGHSKGIALKIGKTGTLLSFDQDKTVFEKPVAEEIHSLTHFIPVVSNFRYADIHVRAAGIEKIDGALLDLGLSSTQLEHSERGFSFKRDEPLFMTFSAEPEHADVTAETVVNEWQEEVIANVLYGFAEEKFSRRIARAIIDERQKKRIRTTGELVDIIQRATPGWYHHGKTHFATRTFQALRMAVNDELGSIEDGVSGLLALSHPGTRIAIITFHSVEDRLVKHLFRNLIDGQKASLVYKKPQAASDEELRKNPRSRSAKLRVIEIL